MNGALTAVRMAHVVAGLYSGLDAPSRPAPEVTASDAPIRLWDGTRPGYFRIELLVVVVIIGILVAIAIPVYLNFRQGAYTDTVKSDLRILQL